MIVHTLFEPWRTGIGEGLPSSSPRHITESSHQIFRCGLLLLESSNMGTDVTQPFVFPQIGEETVKANMPQVSFLIMASTLRMVSPHLTCVLG